MTQQKTTVGDWFVGARLRTLPASLVPVAVGTGVVAGGGAVLWGRVALAAVVAVAIQVGTNYANDYSDGVRGTDDTRVGPSRLVASGVATPLAVRRAAIAAFLVAAVCGLVIAALAGWWLIAVGAAAIAAGWLYTGGPRPYGYEGLGELFVFVFFGLVAAVGSAYVQLERLTWLAVAASVPVGLLAVSLLVTNNLRDLPRDGDAGKRTLAVRIGDAQTRKLYIGCLAVAFLAASLLVFVTPWSLLVLAALPVAAIPVTAVRRGSLGVDLIPVLGATGRLQLIFGALLTVGLALG